MGRSSKQKHPGAVDLGRRGGNARARNLTSEEIAAIGRYGASNRWAKVAAVDVARQRRSAELAVELVQASIRRIVAESVLEATVL